MHGVAHDSESASIVGTPAAVLAVHRDLVRMATLREHELLRSVSRLSNQTSQFSDLEFVLSLYMQHLDFEAL